MSDHQKRGPKPTGRRRVVRYWTDEEIKAADRFVQWLRAPNSPRLEVVKSEGGEGVGFWRETRRQPLSAGVDATGILDAPCVRFGVDAGGILRAIRTDGALKEDSENM